MRKLLLTTMLCCPLFLQATFTRHVSSDKEGNRTYTGTCKFEKPKGLIEISLEKYNNYKGEIVVELQRGTSKEVIIKAFLNKDTVKRHDKSITDNTYKQYGWIWTPWWTNEKLRGGNRLKIQITQLGKYIITVPFDADTQVKLSHGNIVYTTDKKTAPTHLKTHGQIVAHPANCMLDNTGVTEITPLTTLIAKTGHITIADDYIQTNCN